MQIDLTSETIAQKVRAIAVSDESVSKRGDELVEFRVCRGMSSRKGRLRWSCWNLFPMPTCSGIHICSFVLGSDHVQNTGVKRNRQMIVQIPRKAKFQIEGHRKDGCMFED